MRIVDLHRSAIEGVIVAEFVVVARMVANFIDGEDQIRAVGILNLFECALLHVVINAVILNELEINRQIIFLAILDFRSIGAVCLIEMPAPKGKEGRLIDQAFLRQARLDGEGIQCFDDPVIGDTVHVCPLTG